MKKNIIIILTLIQGVLLVLSGCTRMVSSEVSETEDITTTITKETEETTKEEFDSGEVNLSGYEQYDEAIANGGFYLTDLNNDEIPELLLGGNGDGAWAGRVYEIYTIKDEKAVKLVSGSLNYETME